VLLAGPQAGGARAADPDVLVTDYAPHSQLFPRASAVIHHGGIGTAAQALRAGKPQLVVPFFADQPDNAVRLEGLGVARALAEGAYRPDAVARALGQLLRGPHAARAADLSRRLADENGPARAADRIEALLSRPPHRLTA
jgi:UDP:flavonoid glycosyltransferase YjiC (YdhE family)